MLRIKLVKSPVAHNPRNRATIAALGLRKIHQVVEQEDTLTVRGMIRPIRDLVIVEEVEGTPTKVNPVRTFKDKPVVIPQKPVETKAAKKPAARKKKQEEEK